ncbi:MAG TPA: MFS transporter [Solirubrobacteraceae bacterium]|jgi:DHA2 family methylenomycin A resistance protein-like MFS transporter
MTAITSPARERRARTWTLVATSLGFSVVQLDVSVVNVAIKPIGAALGGGVSDLQWVVSAYTVAFASFILSAGALGDRIGAKRMFVAGFGLFTLASAACGLAPTLAVLISARAIQGIGAAVLVPCSLTLLGHEFPEPAERARAIGLWAAGASVALSAGPLVGGVLTAGFGWRAIFFINAPIGIAGILLTLRWASETSRSTERGIDVPGQLAAIVGLGSLAAATIEGGNHGFTSAFVLAGYVVAAVGLVAFLVIEARTREPMLPLSLFRSRPFAAATAIGLLINIAFYGLIFVLSLYFQRAQGFSALHAGLAFAPMTIVVMGSNILAGRLAGRIGPRPVVLAGAVLMAACLAALLGAGTGTPYGEIVVQLMGIGFGIGLIVPVITSAVLGSVERSRSGIAAGTLNTARQTGSAIGVALYGSLIAGGRIVAGLHVSLVISVGLALVVAALAGPLGRD